MTGIRARIIEPRFGLPDLAKQPGSVSQACRVTGYSRDSFYRFKKLHEQGNEEAPMDLSRRKPAAPPGAAARTAIDALPAAPFGLT